MNISYLRQSSINTYNDCQFKYFVENLLQIPGPAGKKALLGTICHHVWEILARCKKNNHLTGKYVDTSYLLKICWERYKKEEGHRLDLEPADYRFCEKTIAKVIDSPFNPLNLNILDTEKQFQLPIKRDGFSYEYYDIINKTVQKGWYEIRGTIDLITKIDDDTIEVIDWKTGRRTDWATGKEKDYEYLATKDIQLRLYDIAVALLYPQYKNRLLTIHFVNDGGAFTVAFTNEQREETYEILKNEFNIIQSNPVPSRLKEVKPQDAKWKCTKVCHYGKTLAPNGISWCDNLYSFMLNSSVDDTLLKVKEIKDKKASENNDKISKTSNRRNDYKVVTE